MSKQRHTNIEIHTYLQKESEKKERINVLRRAALHQNHAFQKLYIRYWKDNIYFR